MLTLIFKLKFIAVLFLMNSCSTVLTYEPSMIATSGMIVKVNLSNTGSYLIEINCTSSKSSKSTEQIIDNLGIRPLVEPKNNKISFELKKFELIGFFIATSSSNLKIRNLPGGIIQLSDLDYYVKLDNTSNFWKKDNNLYIKKAN